MNCDQCNGLLGDAVDGTLAPELQEQLEAHCRGCEACGELLNDLREIRAAAARLDRMTPAPELWTAIEAKVRTPGAPPLRTGSPALSLWGLAAAAALVIMLGTASWFALAPGGSGPGSQSTVDLARNAASELQLAEQHYQNAITSLEKLTVNKDSELDPAVAAEIAQSLLAIDRAIKDSRTALMAEPESFVAQTSLLEALRMKVAVLQQTVSLMNSTS